MHDHIAKLERDFAERLSAAPNFEQLFQYFQKDTSLGMEGITVYLKPHGKSEFETQFYSILTTERNRMVGLSTQTQREFYNISGER